MLGRAYALIVRTILVAVAVLLALLLIVVLSPGLSESALWRALSELVVIATFATVLQQQREACPRPGSPRGPPPV